MKQFIKENFAILLAFLLPIILILVVALTTYLPSIFLSTKYNFLYVTCDTGTNYYDQTYCNNYLLKRYTIEDGKLKVNPIDMTKETEFRKSPDFNGKYSGRIFLHDTKKNESRGISIEEAKLLTLNSLLTSPDGVTVTNGYDYRGGDLFFLFGGGNSSYEYYLAKGKSKTKLNLVNSYNRYYYQNNFQFLGWVLPGRD